MEKTNCIHYKIRNIISNASNGSIAEATDAIPESYCDHPDVDKNLGELPCENCPYFEEATKKD